MDIFHTFFQQRWPSTQQRRLPQCIIIGQRKAGTKALITFLKGTHPDIVTPRKETHFFDKVKNYRRGLEYYRNQMPTSEAHQITMEKTPAYFFTPGVPERIKQMNESIKLILIVRDPVRRMISDYLHNEVRRNRSPQKKKFEVTTLICSQNKHHCSDKRRLRDFFLHFFPSRSWLYYRTVLSTKLTFVFSTQSITNT